MKLSQEQQSRLKKLGYKVRAGNVYDKEGGFAGTINPQGRINSSDTRVRRILSEGKTSAPTTSKKPKARPAAAKVKTTKAKPTASTSTSGPPTRSGPRRKKPILSAPPKVTESKLPSGNDPVVSAARRVLNKTSSNKKPASTNQKPTEVKPGKSIGELLGVSAKREAGQAYQKSQREQEEINKNKPSFGQFSVDRLNANREEFRKDPNKFTQDSKALYEKKYGSVAYAKGGLVKANCGASMKPTQRKR